MNGATPVHTVHPLRACQRCLQHTQAAQQLYCTNRTVAGPQLAVRCEEARAVNGGCGPNAQHLNWPGVTDATAHRAPTPPQAIAA